ncbi:MAG: type II toxin-antitoxin system mRNA interferase toxin, RelE/StbE family [Candidatus Levybacteria bacterium]|nr:type II toxin-antitoxin system mRNA interferase toxin, RelE/StbE family [Candidatus Levybacteria bacterium]
MTIQLHRNFKKQYEKLTDSQKRKFKERRSIFLQDEFNPILNNHALKGAYQGYRSINITGDIRVIYINSSGDAVFVKIGSRSSLYG